MSWGLSHLWSPFPISPELQPSGDPLLGLPEVGLAAPVHHCVVTWLLLYLVSLQIPAYLISISGSKIGFMRTTRDQAELVIYLHHWTQLLVGSCCSSCPIMLCTNFTVKGIHEKDRLKSSQRFPWDWLKFREEVILYNIVFFLSITFSSHCMPTPIMWHRGVNHLCGIMFSKSLKKTSLLPCPHQLSSQTMALWTCTNQSDFFLLLGYQPSC